MEKRTISQYEKMTQTPIPTLLIQLSIPTIISMLITNIYNLADTAFVGQLGNSASGAVGVVFGFMSIIQAIGYMFGQGSGSIISRSLGNKDINHASVTASTGFFCALLCGCLITVCGFFSLDMLVKILGSTETIAPYAKTYIAYILVAAPFMTAGFLINNVLRYEGTGKRVGAAILSSLRSGLFFIPALLILSRLRGLYGIEEAQPIAYVLGFIPSLFFMLWFFKRLPKEEE